MRDLLQSVRGLRKSPGFTATAVLALAVGIGSTSSIFSLLDAMMLRPLPFRDAGRLVMLSERPPGFGRNALKRCSARMHGVALMAERGLRIVSRAP